MSARLRGVGLVLVAAFATACMGLFAKEALERGSDPRSLLALRYLATAVLLGLPVLLVRAFPFRSRAARRRALAIGIAMFIGGLCEIEALARLPLSVVIVILFISPLWLALYSRAVRGERLGAGRQLAFAFVFAGIVCLVGPAVGDYDLVGLLYALGSSFAWAGILLGIEASDDVEGFSPPVAVAIGAVVAATIALLTAPLGVVEELGHGDRLPWFLALGIAATIGFGLISLAMRDQHVFDVSVVAATEPLFAVLLGAVALDERLSAVQLLGTVAIAFGVTLIATAGRSQARSAPVFPVP
ncbi:MAG TPA: DMT family transporter [Solirubrobacterales bacterium]|nr:DMT family transporter [Solirubrobacterales bacterium]